MTEVLKIQQHPKIKKNTEEGRSKHPCLFGANEFRWNSANIGVKVYRLGVTILFEIIT